MLVTTTCLIPEYEIVSYVGIVSASEVASMYFFKDFLTVIKDFFGGKSQDWVMTIQESMQTTLTKLISQAHTLKANAIIGLDPHFTFIPTGRKGGGFIVINLTGTAVVIKKKENPRFRE
jgi:uncharacterized protein YbjQ (UPF0145 family)